METSPPLKIAFGCQARVGKSSAVKYLIETYGGKEFAFAQPIYHLLFLNQFYLGLEQKKDREFLQMIGMWGRKQNINIWVNFLLKEVSKHSGNVLVSDVRFPNELRALKEQGFLCVRIIRKSSTEDPSFGSGRRNHPSETSLVEDSAMWDKIIYNDGSLEDFHLKLENLVNSKES